MSRKPKPRVDPIEVFCRLRPLSNDTESCVKVIDDFNLLLQLPESSSYFKNGQINQYIYSFAQIFDEETKQKDIFEQVCLPLVQDLLSGKNGALFTYGVTGSGKTHTMTGSQQDLGMLPRCLDTIFNSISFQQSKKYVFKPDKANAFEIQSEAEAMLERQKREVLPSLNGNRTPGVSHSVQAKIQKLKASGFAPAVSATPNGRARADAERLNDPNGKLVNVNEDHTFAVFVTCVEIYNNYIYDLLEDTDKRIDNTRESKMLKEDVKGANYVKDVTELEVKSTEEALELMHRAMSKRSNGSNGLNEVSSRSHCIFTIRVAQAAFDPSVDMFSGKNKPPVYVSQLSLVDLAGSERSKRTNAKGARIYEAGGINQSLMSLRNCMEILRENLQNGTRKMVPYRETKLTQLFKNYFEGNGKIKMVLCVNPSAVECDETISVLKFSETVRDVLIPVATSEVPAHAAQQRYSGLKPPGSSLEALEQANAFLLANLQQNNFTFMHESFPALDVLSADDEETIPRLIDYLEEFARKRDAAIHESDLLKQQLSMRMRELEDENARLREERNELQKRLDSRDKDQQRFEMKIKALEKVIGTSSINRSTPVQLTNKENRFVTPGAGPGSGSATGGSGLGSALITSNNSSANNSREKAGASGETPVASTYRSSRVTTTTTQSIGRNVIFSSQNSTNGAPPVPVHTPSSNRVVTTLANNYTSGSNSRYQSPMRQAPAPPSKEGVPVANRRAMNRRSRSADTWLDHKPPTAAKTETVLQPKLARKKSVSKLELSDTKKSSRYLLTHQEQDDEGELVTNLIKGDILKSPSGGASVIFTDVETLKTRTQEIPKAHRQRASADLPVEDRAVIEDRCSTAIEGHSRYKFMKQVRS